MASSCVLFMQSPKKILQLLTDLLGRMYTLVWHHKQEVLGTHTSFQYWKANENYTFLVIIQFSDHFLCMTYTSRPPHYHYE